MTDVKESSGALSDGRKCLRAFLSLLTTTYIKKRTILEVFVMKTTTKRQIRKKEGQSRVKREVTKKRSIQETNRENDQHFYYIEGVCFESGV